MRLWANTFDEVAPYAIEGIYVVGSAALGDWHEHSSDLDIIAITSEPADEETAGTLLTAHAAFAQRNPGPSVDGPFLAWGDLVVSPQGSNRPWTLDGHFRHDAECFELNPVTWYMLATYGIALRGPAPHVLGIPVDAEERIRFVIDNADSYWRSVHTEFAGALGELQATDTLPSSVPVWCLLGTLRMLYTATTGDITSKSGAGRWAVTQLDSRWSTVCEEVVELRRQPEAPVGFALLQQAAAAMGDALQQISRLGEKYRPRAV